MTNSSSRRLGATNSSSWLRGTSWIWSVCPRLPGSSSWLPWWRHSSALFFSTTSKEMQRESRIETEPSSSSPWACHSTLFKTSSWFSQTKDLCSWEKPTTTCIPWARTSGPRFILSSRRLSWPQQSSAQSVTTWLDSAQYSGINSLPSVSPNTFSNFYFLVLILFLIYNASGGYALILGTIFSDK